VSWCLDVADGQNLVASFTNTFSYATDGYFEIVGTLTLPTSGDCPSSWRAYQTIEAGTTSCFAAPIVVTAGPSSVVTVTYIYEDCPANMEEIARTITVVCFILCISLTLERVTLDSDGEFGTGDLL
jgi:hypothetical protein